MGIMLGWVSGRNCPNIAEVSLGLVGVSGGNPLIGLN